MEVDRPLSRDCSNCCGLCVHVHAKPWLVNCHHAAMIHCTPSSARATHLGFARMRQKCRSPKRFSPSVALWQYFVLPHREIRQYTSASSAHASVDPSTTSNNEAGPHMPSNGQSDATLKHNQTVDTQPSFTIRKGSRRFETPVKKSIHGNRQQQPAVSSTAIAQPTRTAYTAPTKLEDYEGVVLKPLHHSDPRPETEYPWCIQGLRNESEGYERYKVSMMLGKNVY